MLHVQLYGPTGEGKCAAIARYGILPSTGELSESVFVVAARGGGDDLEMGEDKGRKAQEGNEVHLEKLYVEITIICE